MSENFNDSANQSIESFTNQLDTIQKINSLANEHFKTNFNTINDKIYIEQLDFMISVSDISSLINIANLDLSVISKFLCNPNCSSSKWERIFFTKNACLTIFETLKTFEKYRKFLHDVASTNFPNLKQDFNNINNLIKIFKKQFDYDGKISFIRNNVSGHINDNVELYYKTIQSFNEDETIKMIDNFFFITYSLHTFLIAILMQDEIKEKMENIKNIAKERVPDLSEKMKSLK